MDGFQICAGNGASAGGPPEAQGPQPKAAALVFSMYFHWKNVLKTYVNCWTTLRTRGLQQQEWWKTHTHTYIYIYIFHTFWMAWIPNTHIIASFLTILKLGRYQMYILLQFCWYFEHFWFPNLRIIVICYMKKTSKQWNLALRGHRFYAWLSNLCREGASAGGPPEAQAPQPTSDFNIVV